MKRNILIIALVFILSACSTVMFTGRKQVLLIPNAEMNAMAMQSYSEFMNENTVSTNASYQNQLKTVGNKMKVAVEKYAAMNGLQKDVASYNWEFNVVEDNQVNAWAMPGGKIVFYSGIMPVCENESGIAVVMGHEIAHVLAKHGNERMSQQMLAQVGNVGLNMYIKDKPEKSKQLFNSAYAVGAQYLGILPFSRLHEREADRVGQIIMALAGYDPADAVSFWKKMNSMSGGQAPPEFLSTHPSYDTRIQVLTENIANARNYAKK